MADCHGGSSYVQTYTPLKPLPYQHVSFAIIPSQSLKQYPYSWAPTNLPDDACAYWCLGNPFQVGYLGIKCIFVMAQLPPQHL
jgi:hypothetical protein